MRPTDIAECVRIIGMHPVIGPRYGDAIGDLGPAWQRVLGCEAHSSVVLEDVEQSQSTIGFVGLSVFVRDDFVRDIKRPPPFWIGPELARRIMRGRSPLLSSGDFRAANSRGGLNLVVWEGCFRAEFEREPEIRKVMNAFIEDHRGYLLKEIVSSQMESVERLNWTLKSGSLLWNPEKGCYVDSVKKDPGEICREPHILGVTRETDRSRFGSWVGSLFEYHPPRMGFSQGEQRLLSCALSGGTDEELSARLGTSLSTIKNTWRSIYNRAASRLPELFPEAARADENTGMRGKEKRRRLLTYLREHPEELRPVSRRLLQQRHP